MMKTILISIVILNWISSLQSISISPCAKWNTTGKTIAGTGVSGRGNTQLSYPQGIFIHDKTKYLYVSDTYNNRIQIFPLDQSTKVGISLLSSLKTNFKIYLDDDDNYTAPIIYIAMSGAHRVEKWIPGASRGIPIGDSCQSCSGVWLDKDKNVYMTEHDKHRILKWSSETNTTTIVAGETNKKSSRADHLNEPQGIVVDKTTNALYIADLINHRIQKWEKDAKVGITVAGSSEGDPGSDAKTLDRPYGLRVDEETKTVYVVDLMNNRIQRWKHGATEGETIAGGNGLGDKDNQFYHPTDLAFDDKGNLYVCESWNHRIQFFNLIDNQPCVDTSSTTTTENPSTASTPPVNSSSRELIMDLSFLVILILMKLF